MAASRNSKDNPYYAKQYHVKLAKEEETKEEILVDVGPPPPPPPDP